MGYSPLATARVQAHASNYTPGRQNKISRITVHHMAAVWTAQRCGQLFQSPDRSASSHYGIGVGGEIANYVDENDTAWADGNWDSNTRTVSIETADADTAWNISAASFDSLVRLVADIAKRNGLGVLTLKNNLWCHRWISSTACPGDYLANKMQELADKANAINYPPASAKPTWVAMDTPRKLRSIGAINLVNVVTGAVVKSYPAKSEFDFNQKTTWNSAQYLRTPYSSSNNIDNGFLLSQLEEISVITTEDVTTVTDIPFDVTSNPEPSMFVGEEKIVQDGVNGKRTVITRITYTDGKETSRSVVSDKTTAPTNQVIYYGTKHFPTPEPPQDDVENQPSENCEMGSNTSTVPETPSLDFPQGGITKLWGIFVAWLISITNKLRK